MAYIDVCLAILQMFAGFQVANAQSTTCQAVSRPVSTRVVTYSSGDTLIFPDTTFTAATTITSIDEPTIVARCFTLSPGQTLPASVSFVDVVCTTGFYSGTTDIYTITSGEKNPVLGTTYTADTTRTVVVQPTNYVYCSAVPDYRNPTKCDAVAPLTWASLALTFATIHLTWWVFEVPLLFKAGHGPRAFLDAVSWACVRAHAPSSAAVIAASKGRGAAEFARIYYLGMRRQEAPPAWTRFKLATCIGSDVLSIVAVIVTVYQACTLPEFDGRRFGASFWAYPSLPVALIGLCLLVGEWSFPKKHSGSVWLFWFTLAVLVVVGAMIAVVLWKFSSTDDIWFVSVIFYAIQLLPVLFLQKLAPILLMWAWFVRVGGVSFAALAHYGGGQPYCKLQGAGFAAVYIALGGVAAILGVFGAFYHAKTAPLFQNPPQGRNQGLSSKRG
jgi:hypothetical protein